MEKIIRENILGVDFDAVTLSEAVTRGLVYAKDTLRQHVVVTPNPEIVLHAHSHPNFAALLNKASMSIPDGVGILWASAFKNRMLPPGKLKERVPGVDFMTNLVDALHDGKVTIFLLGAGPGIAKKVAEILLKKHPTLAIVGTDSGSPLDEDFADIKAKIDGSGAQVLFVAFGAPKQEEWIFAHLKQLASVRLAVGVGGTFDFIAGKRKRAPAVMRKFGLEWLWRLVQEPKRIKRIFNAVVKFPWVVITRKTKKSQL